MTNHPATDRGPAPTARVGRSRLEETKSAFRTTELILYILAVVAVLIASAVVDDNDNGQGFSAQTAWMFVTWLTIGYLLSRGLAKSGSPRRDHATDD